LQARGVEPFLFALRFTDLRSFVRKSRWTVEDHR
jgi:hypothetical protein